MQPALDPPADAQIPPVTEGEGPVPSRAHASARSLGIIRPHAGPIYITPPPAANDDELGAVAAPRKNTRRKPWAADLRTNTTTRSIAWGDYWEGRAAWHQSWKIGLGLDCMVTIRPRIFAQLVAVERYEETQRWMRQMREMYRAKNDNLPEYAYLLTREASRDGTGEHVHWLMPTAGRQDIVKAYLKGKFTGEHEAFVEVADPWPRILECGKVGNASTYLLKAACKSLRDRYPEIPFRLSGPVWGPRVFWSENLNPVRPRYRVPAPKRPKGRTGRPSDEIRAA